MSTVWVKEVAEVTVIAAVTDSKLSGRDSYAWR
jgi:hypothetical protein